MEDSGAKHDLNSECLNQEVSEEKNVSMWPETYLLIFCFLSLAEKSA